VRSAKDAVGAALAFRGIADAVRAERVLTEWGELVGPKIASRTRPLCVDGRALVVEVATSAWLHELTLLKPQILAGLLDRVGMPRPFADVVFRLAGRGKRQEAPRGPRTSDFGLRTEKKFTPATGAAREQIVREVERVDDAELRELIARVRIQHDR
jgi:hypothetical protein